MYKNIKHFTFLLLIISIVSVVFYYLFFASSGAILNYLFLYKNNISNGSNKIVVIKIDNKTLDELQKTDLKVLNLNKKVFSDLIDKLNNYGAKAIGLDIVFQNITNDVNILKESFDKYKNIVIAAKIKDINNINDTQELPLDLYKNTTWGSIGTLKDKDNLNYVTKFKPVYFLDKTPIESFSIALYKKYIQENKSIGQQNNEYIINPFTKMPLDEDGNMLIRFFNLPQGYPNYSLIDVIKGKINGEIFKGKIVLIGEYGTLIHDEFISPVNPNIPMPGVEFHANMLDTILTQDFLQKQSTNQSIIILLSLILLLIIIFYFTPFIISIFAFGIYLLVLIFLGRYLFSVGIVINLFAYITVSFLTFIITYLYKYFIVDKDKHYIQNAFSMYIAPEVVQQIAKNPKALSLIGEKREISIFFSDIAGFTTISENLNAEDLFKFLGEYLSEMTNILIQNKGTLDKYIGDAVMGFFNAPLFIENHEYLACKTALDQQTKLTELNNRWLSKGLPSIVARIGINTGEVMVGNIGSKNRFNYTIIGDHVNLASRLEGVNKEYSTKICVSESVYLKTKNDFIFRELDTIKVKGKNKGIKIYELVGYLNELSIDNKKYKNYTKALYLYYDGKYEEAKILFESNKNDLTSSIMASRCKDIINGKTVVINGIYEMKNK